MAKIELKDISHAYVPGTYAVKNINLTWEDGVASALLGPSGCGKTTLLKIISGLLIPTEGTVLVDGKDVTHLSPRERNIAQVFQFPVVYETLSVFDNLAFPLRNRGFEKSLIKQRVHEIAEILELQDHLDHKASRLGPGEKQRISMGRGIVRDDTSAVLFDEPLTVIDAHKKWLLRRKLKELHRGTNFTMIYVTHDQHEALTFAEQVTVMNVGEVLQNGTPQDLYKRPQTPFVGYFIGSPGMNVLPVQLKGNGLQMGDLLIEMDPPSLPAKTDPAKLQLGIRPEFVNVSAENQPESFASNLTALVRTGQSQILDLQNGDLTFKAIVGERENYQIGQRVWTTFSKPHIMFYENGRLLPSAN